MGKREMEQAGVRKVLENGKIEPSVSPWRANPVLVVNPDGKYRYCADRRNNDGRNCDKADAQRSEWTNAWMYYYESIFRTRYQNRSGEGRSRVELADAHYRKGLRSFFGLCSYYRRFIRGFDEIARPLHRFIGKGVHFEWTSECNDSFDRMRE